MRFATHGVVSCLAVKAQIPTELSTAGPGTPPAKDSPERRSAIETVARPPEYVGEASSLRVFCTPRNTGSQGGFLEDGRSQSQRGPHLTPLLLSKWRAGTRLGMIAPEAETLHRRHLHLHANPLQLVRQQNSVLCFHARRIRATAVKEVGVENAAEETTITRIRTD